ncbi:MAG: hypothetical protein K5787_05925 [Lentisphaeria bacterium]|nr:hypothetical protein [Lentisphaeria bacterium]
MERIVLIDAYAHIYRMYYAMLHSGGFTNPAGQPVGALYGMARLLMQVETTLPSRYGAVAFDKGKATLRCELLPEYKAQRPPMPEDLRCQVEPIKQWMEAFGWPLLMEEGREADDLIASVTARRDGNAVDILAFDKDITQLVCEEVRLLAPGKNGNWIETGIQQVQEKFGVTPQMVPAYLALLGDTSDNIRGVDGIGPKTASKLLTDYGGLDGLRAHLAEIKSERVRKNLEESGDLLERNMKLVILDDKEIAGWNGLETVRRKSPDWEKIHAMAVEQNFKSLFGPIEKAVKAAKQPSLF